MIFAAQAAGVGPMAAVAGALAEQVGQRLLKSTSEVIIENGGDIFIGARQILTVGVYAGGSPLSLKLGLRIDPAKGIRGICTSSGTVGHSLSFGKADAVCVLSDSCALADAGRNSYRQPCPQAVRHPSGHSVGACHQGHQGHIGYHGR